MTPPLLSNSEGTALLDQPAIQPQAPSTARKGRQLPKYRPNGHPGYEPLDPKHADWQRLDAYRGEAGRRGISDEELQEMEIGYCPGQIASQIRELNAWLEAHPA